MQEWTKHERQQKLSVESRERFNQARKDPELFANSRELRMALLDFIADFSNWDNSTDADYLATSRALTQCAHESLGGIPGTRPLVVDPFAGGGSIPLEALRVGGDAFASDLNPIPVLLNKVMLEYIPKYGHRLADEVRVWGEKIKEDAIKELSYLYPKDSDGATPITYLWARTIKCEGPGCGAKLPLVRSFLLGKRKSEYTGVIIDSIDQDHVDFKIETKPTDTDFKLGTLARGSATCPKCGFTTPGNNVRRQSAKQNGGADQSTLLAVYVEKDGKRSYRPARSEDYEAVRNAIKKAQELRSEYNELGVAEIPNEELPYLRSIFNVNLIGIDTWDKMFSSRQLVTLSYLSRQIREIPILGGREDQDFMKAIATTLAFAVDRQADYLSSICTWVQGGEFVGHTFAQGQSLPIKWDFAEAVPFASGSGSWSGALEWICRVIVEISDSKLREGTTEMVSATSHTLPNDSADIIFTDPPYYDAVPYADLSDFFYVWLRRNIGPLHKELFLTDKTNKRDEIVQLAERNKDYAFKTRKNFENLMVNALEEGARYTNRTGLAVIVFAHKETSAWEVMLQAIVNSGWTAVASWPIDTERGGRLRAMSSAALASSVHLVVRPRIQNGRDVVGDWRDVLEELPRRIHSWLPHLAEEGIVGADAIFACLGPALEIFSRYDSVEKASGEEVTLREYLEQVWAAVSREALSTVVADADLSGFEADARLSAMWLWTVAASPDGDEAEDEEVDITKIKPIGFALEYDAARKIAQGLGANLDELKSIVEVKGDTATLLPVAQRTEYLFGKGETEPRTARGRKKQSNQLDMFAELIEEGASDDVWEEKTVSKPGETILDRVHQAMILFASGRGEALKRFLVDDGVGQDPGLWKLAQAFSALYPPGTQEKRWVDGVLARKKGLGL